MRRVGLWALIAVGLASGTAPGAAPTAPSYHAVTRVIDKVRAEWAKPDAPPQPNAQGWIALFETIVADLRAYSAAQGDRERLVALNRLYQLSNALAVSPWGPAVETREALREWLRPRVRLAWAERRLVEQVRALPAPNAAAQGNHEKWVKFVDADLGKALREYDAAATVGKRQTALRSVYAALNALQSRNATYAWTPSIELQAALNDLYNQPNLDVSADVNTLSPLFNVNLVTSGPVYRKGYWSQVTAGPKTGFGLMSSDDGIAFFNKQLLSSVTPIHDFQQQIAGDQQGKRAAKMYQFGATSSDQQELTIITVFRTTGLELIPQFAHNVGLNISTAPQPGGGLSRAVASLVGFGQPKITKKVWEGAYPRMQTSVVQEAAEMGAERTSAEAAQRNAQFRQFLIGNNRLAYQNVLVEGLSLRSRPANALIGGTITYLGASDQVGADAPQPPTLTVPDYGISADLHLSSIASNFARGYLQSEPARRVDNFVVVTNKADPAAPAAAKFSTTQNVDYPTFLKAVETARTANDPKVLAIRIKRPTRAPDFGADERGNLVAVVHDFHLEVPAPRQVAGGGLAGPPARVYRIVAPEAEFTISFKVESPGPNQPLHFAGRVETFDPGPGAKVYAVTDDETKATPLNPVPTALFYGVFRSRIQGQPIDLPLTDLPLRGFTIRSVSPLDPSGWIRVTVDRTAVAAG